MQESLEIVRIGGGLLSLRSIERSILRECRQSRRHRRERWCRADVRRRGSRLEICESRLFASHLADDIGQRLDVVLGQGQGFDLGQLPAMPHVGYDLPQSLEGVVQEMHALPLALVTLDPAPGFLSRRGRRRRRRRWRRRRRVVGRQLGIPAACDARPASGEWFPVRIIIIVVVVVVVAVVAVVAVAVAITSDGWVVVVVAGVAGVVDATERSRHGFLRDALNRRGGRRRRRRGSRRGRLDMGTFASQRSCRHGRHQQLAGSDFSLLALFGACFVLAGQS